MRLSALQNEVMKDKTRHKFTFVNIYTYNYKIGEIKH